MLRTRLAMVICLGLLAPLGLVAPAQASYGWDSWGDGKQGVKARFPTGYGSPGAMKKVQIKRNKKAKGPRQVRVRWRFSPDYGATWRKWKKQKWVAIAPGRRITRPAPKWKCSPKLIEVQVQVRAKKKGKWRKAKELRYASGARFSPC